MTTRSRKELVSALVQYELPIEPVTAALAKLPWDSAELVEISPEHLVAILDRYLRGELNTEQLVDWANRIEGRDDIGFAPLSSDVVKNAIFTLANPDITEAINPDVARHLRGRILRLPAEAG